MLCDSFQPRTMIVYSVIVLLIGVPTILYGFQEARGMIVSDGGSGFYTEGSAVSRSGPSYSGSICSDCANALDTEVATGGSAGGAVYLLEAVDFGFRIYIVSQNLYWGSGNFATLFGIPSSQNCGDPRVLFDSQSGRWFASILQSSPDCSYSGNLAIDIAVSISSDPTIMPWKVTQIKETKGIADHEEFAVSSDKLTLTSFLDSSAWVISKNDLINQVAGYSIQHLQLPATLPSCNYQITPVRAVNPSATQYMICNHNNSSMVESWLFNVTGFPPNGTKAALISSTPATSFPAPGQTVNTPSGLLYPVRGDQLRAENGYWMNGYIWFTGADTCNPGDGNHNCVRLTKVLTSYPMIVLQDFDFKVRGLDLFLPALSMDGFGDLSLIFAYSSSSIQPTLAVTGQTGSDLPGTVTPYLNLITSLTNTGRLDYFGASPDPSNLNQVWVIGGYWPSSGWGTYAYGVRFVGLEMWASPDAINFTPGTTVNTTVAIEALSTLSGSVQLSGSVAPSSYASGYHVSVSPTSIQLSLYGRATVSATLTSTNPHPGGSFNLTVTASTPDLSLTLPIPVNVPSPNCSASANPTSGSYAITVQFNVSCSGGYPPYSYSWNFGDGSSCNNCASNPTETYYSNGYGYSYYYPTVTITDQYGTTSTPSLPTIRVWGGSPCPGSYSSRVPSPNRVCL